MLTLLLIVLLVAALVGAGWGHSRWGYPGWSPAALILAVILVMWFTGVVG